MIARSSRGRWPNRRAYRFQAAQRASGRAAGIWKEKDVIDTLPDEAGIFLFTMRDGRMTHTGVSVGGGEEVDARGHAYGVVRRKIRDTSYTHWARLAIDYDAPAEMKIPRQRKRRGPPLRRGASGETVRHVQQMLIDRGYSLDPYGADGKFGKTTQEAVKRFQADHALGADGVVGPATWAALDATQAGGDIEEEEPEEMVRLCLTGAAMNALVRAMRDAQAVGGRMRLELDEADYRELMRQIEDEA